MWGRFRFPRGSKLPPAIPTTEPLTFMAGDTVTWTKSLADYTPADPSTISYAIVGPTVVDGTQVSIAADGTAWDVVLPASLTRAMIAGAYTWTLFATNAGARAKVDGGVFVVEANAAAVVAPTLSHAAKMVAIIESLIEGRVPADVESYSINGRSLTKMKVSELMALRTVYRNEVWREQNTGADAPARYVRFGPNT